MYTFVNTSQVAEIFFTPAAPGIVTWAEALLLAIKLSLTKFATSSWDLGALRFLNNWVGALTVIGTSAVVELGSEWTGERYRALKVQRSCVRLTILFLRGRFQQNSRGEFKYLS